ncbi:MAG: response regulator transcription factor [Anaerovorax sp.]
MSQDKVMIVDNEMEIIQLLRLYLSKEGFQVVWTTDSTEALALAKAEQPDLILLDIVMPGLSGFEVCNQIREYFNIPILFISCKGDDTDKILGLSLGGDDYITKPFSPSEVIARVKAHLRRSHLNAPSEDKENLNKTLTFNEITIDPEAHAVMISGKEVHLTVKEFELLMLLCQYPNRVFTSKQIFGQIWDSYGLEEDFRTVMVHVSNLRKKIETDPEHPKHIHTVRGVGYKFVV